MEKTYNETSRPADPDPDAEDDADDRKLTQEALDESRVVNELRFVEDGEELMDYLRHKGKYTDSIESPRPGLILLDLNMPRKDGREALQEIKADPDLRRIPVVVMLPRKLRRIFFAAMTWEQAHSSQNR